MLSDEQRGFFARNGFLRVEGLVDDDLCSYLRDETWRRLPNSWDRTKPATWTGDVADSCHVASLPYRRGHLKFQKGSLTADTEIRRGFADQSRLHHLIQTMIGAELEPVYVRGLYCIIPTPGWAELPQTIVPHVESHAMHVVAIAYLEEINPGEGGLHVWPGSHAELYPAFRSKLDYTATAKTKALVEKYHRRQPVEITGKRGDVLLMHHRLFHAASLNKSPTKIRFSLFCDYRRADWRTLSTQAPSDLWEDWPAIQGRFQVQQPDFTLVERKVMESATSLARNKLHVSTRNKADASRIARLRQDGDIWLAVSDNAQILGTNKLHPVGGDLAISGISVDLNGERLTSISENDLIVPIKPRNGDNEIVVMGPRGFIGVRIIRTRIPVTDSKVVIRHSLQSDKVVRRIRFNNSALV